MPGPLARSAMAFAARRYRRAVRRAAADMPAGSEDANVLAFDALQHDAYEASGWRGLMGAWLAEARSLSALRRERRNAGAGPSARGALRGVLMTSILHDLRDAWRALRRTPGYTLVVIATLALGIGANTAIFSVVDALMLKALPYAEPDRIVQAAEWPETGGNFTVAPAAFVHWRVAAADFVQLEARQTRRFILLDAGTPVTVSGAVVTAGFFDVFGVTAAIGRTFGPDDEAPDAGCRAVVSHRLWRERLGSDEAALGSIVRLSDTPCVVVGILPAASVFDQLSAEVYVPLVFSPAEAARQGRNLRVVGRLAPDVTLDQARDRLAAVAAAFNATRGEAGQGWTSTVTPWRDVVVRADTRTLVWVLFGAVTLVLAIACANVAGLALSRAVARQRELAIRAALGAGRWRLIRYLTVESLVLGLAGGAAGLLVGRLSLDAILSAMPTGLLPAEAAVGLGLDPRTLVFTAAIALFTGLLFGTAPAWQATRSAVSAGHVGDNRTQSASRATSRLHAGLVIAEIAIAMVLITGAVLLVTSFVRLGSVNPGFDASSVLTMQIALPNSRYPAATDNVQFIEDAMARLRSAPGVADAAAVTSLPLGGWLYGTRFRVEGEPDDPERPTFAHIQHVTDRYFETLRLDMAAGRTFTSADRTSAPPVAIVNETFVRRHVPEGPAVGRRLQLGIEALGQPADAQWEIVGVVRNVKTGGLDEAAFATPEIYVPIVQSPIRPMYVAVRGRESVPGALEPAIRDAIRSLDAELPIDDIRTMDERIGLSVRTERFTTTMFSTFAALAALLAGFGIYSVRARAVTARRREMGIRLALGATRGDVLRLVLRQGLRLALAGVALGLTGAVALSRTLDAWLFDTTATDPALLVAAIALVSVPAVLASWVPARRAAAVDPNTALRAD